jgi:ATP-dependent RNA helicase RhlE
MSFSSLGLDAPILKALHEEGYTTPTPIQLKAIPVILAKKDILAGAQTGTGKTAGFTLPLLQLLSQKKGATGKPHIRALILTPTRELAAQVGQSVETYGKYLSLKSTVIFGGVGINPQISTLKKGIDILTATPGRLLDHVGQKTIDLSKVEFLILDEADRMLDMGFINDIKKVLALLPKTRQNLLFSATFSDEIKALADNLLNNPVLIEVARRNETSGGINQAMYELDKEKKKLLLVHLIKTGDWKQVLVFTRTKHGANKLSEYLSENGISSSAIHGNKSQGARTKALDDFKSGQVRVLVATDIAARGIDIDLLPHVVNFELPNVSEDYVHRIGRTGRAGNEGSAISLVCGEELEYLNNIQRLIKQQIKQIFIEGFTSKQVYVAEVKPQRGQQKGFTRDQKIRSERSARGDNRAGEKNKTEQSQRKKPDNRDKKYWEKEKKSAYK